MHTMSVEQLVWPLDESEGRHNCMVMTFGLCVKWPIKVLDEKCSFGKMKSRKCEPNFMIL